MATLGKFTVLDFLVRFLLFLFGWREFFFFFFVWEFGILGNGSNLISTIMRMITKFEPELNMPSIKCSPSDILQIEILYHTQKV
jgi:hypothetical protein